MTKATVLESVNFRMSLLENQRESAIRNADYDYADSIEIRLNECNLILKALMAIEE